MLSAPQKTQHHRHSILTAPGAAPVRRWRAPVEEEGNWWTITFSDLVLLLLCFVVLWHLADKRNAQQQLMHSQKTEIPHPQDTQPPIEAAIRLNSTTEATAVTPQQPEPAKSPDESATVSLPSSQSVAQPVATNTGWQELQHEIKRYVAEQGLDRSVGVVSSEHGLVISLSDTITFPSGQATLNATVTPFLAQVAALASERTELNIEIAGHTDDRPIATPEFPSNWELSAARASRVARTLLEQERIDPTRVSTRGYAHYRPLYANDTDEHRAANRRVEIRFFRRVETSGGQGYEW